MSPKQLHQLINRLNCIKRRLEQFYSLQYNRGDIDLCVHYAGGHALILVLIDEAKRQLAVWRKGMPAEIRSAGEIIEPFPCVGQIDPADLLAGLAATAAHERRRA